MGEGTKTFLKVTGITALIAAVGYGIYSLIKNQSVTPVATIPVVESDTAAPVDTTVVPANVFFSGTPKSYSNPITGHGMTFFIYSPAKSNPTKYSYPISFSDTDIYNALNSNLGKLPPSNPSGSIYAVQVGTNIAFPVSFSTAQANGYHDTIDELPILSDTEFKVYSTTLPLNYMNSWGYDGSKEYGILTSNEIINLPSSFNTTT